MIRFSNTLGAALLVLTSLTTVQAQNTVYWDINGSEPGAGNVGGFTDGVWGTDPFWNPLADGTGATGPWVPGDNAVFSAGSDAVDHFIDITGTQLANSITVEDGSVFFASGIADTQGGNIDIESGATLRIGSILTLDNNGGKVILNGGTFLNSNPGDGAGSFMRNTKSIEVTGTGIIDFTSLELDNSVGAGTISIYTPIDGNSILGTGGTVDNGGAGTLIKEGPGELRYQGTGLPLTTYAKLVVNEGLFRLGFNASIQDTRGFGADPLVETPDAITLNGGAIGTSFLTSMAQVHPNRGVAIGPNGGTFNVSGGGLGINGPLTAAAGTTLTVVGISTVQLNNANNVNTFNGNLVVNGGVASLLESLATPNLSGTGGAVSVAADKTFTVGSDGTDSNYAGNITGAGNLTKTGAGTLTLAGAANSYAGNTTVEAGTLSLSSATLADAADIFLTTGALLNLNFAGNDIINSLFIDGTAQAIGIYGAPASGAQFETGLLSGSGFLDVTSSGAVAGLVGDYNNDGTVNAADYTVWRDNLGAATLEFNRDPANAGAVSQADYDSWANNFGATAGAGAGGTAAIPEPASLVLAALALVGLLGLRRRSK